MFRKDLRYYIFLLVLIFAYWNTPNSFFWRDEWNFLTDIMNQEYDIFSPHVGHIFPVFKSYYYVQLYLFGTISILYLYSNLFLHFLTHALLFHFLKEKVFVNKNLAITIAGLMAIHPVAFNTLLWTFQSCQLLQIFFQLLSVVFFINFIDSKNRVSFCLSMTFLVLQNYCFGNGLLMPIPLILGSLFISDWKTRLQSVALLSLMLLTFLSVQAFWGGNNVAISIPDSVRTFFYYNAVNSFRYLFIKNPALLSPYIVYFLALPLVVLALRWRLVFGSKRAVVFLSWFIASSVLIPVARNQIYLTDFPPYYSFASFLPFCLLVVEVFKNDLTALFENKRVCYYLPIVIAIFGFTYFLVDRRMVATFSFRNYQNEAALKNSISRNEEYLAFDDPYFVETSKMPTDNLLIMKVKDPKGTYLYWQAINKFNFLLPTSQGTSLNAK